MATQNFGIRRLGSAVGKRLRAVAASASAGRARRERHAALTEQHRLHFDLLCKAMDDSALAAVLDTYESDIPAERQRQYLFANALYVNALYYHRIGAWSLNELYGHLRVICRNSLFREYWAATRHHRQSLPDSSEEAELGRMMDGLVREMDRVSREAEEGDLEEWWVVGQPPEE